MKKCYNCGYFREEKRPNGSIRNYCNDLDCTVDPYDPECNYNLLKEEIMNKYIKTDIDQGIQYLRIGIMNALAAIESDEEETIVLGYYVPFSLVIDCAKQRGWTDDEKQSYDWTNGWEVDCWWYMYTPDGRKNVCIESCLWLGQPTKLIVNHNE